MQSIRYPQREGVRLQIQSRSEFRQKAHGDVWQDRRAVKRARTALRQASPLLKSSGAHRLHTNSDRGQNAHPRRKTVQVVAWVVRPISSQIDAKAAEWQLTRSKAADRLIRMGLAQDFFGEFETQLTQAVGRAVAREHQIDRDRFGTLLFRLSVKVSQLFYLVVNLLGRSGSQRRVTAEQLDKIIEWSRTEAKEDVVKRTRKTEALHRAIAEWLAGDATTKQDTKQRKEEQSN
jgi:hypothetical protein